MMIPVFSDSPKKIRRLTWICLDNNCSESDIDWKFNGKLRKRTAGGPRVDFHFRRTVNFETWVVG
jgi:hypothetical protein